MKTIRNASVFEGFARFSVKATVSLFCFAVIAGLLVGWLISAPLFKLADRFTRAKNHGRQQQKVKVRLEKKEMGQRVFRAIVWIPIFLALRMSQAQSSIPFAHFVIPALQSSTINIWQSGAGERRFSERKYNECSKAI